MERPTAGHGVQVRHGFTSMGSLAEISGTDVTVDPYIHGRKASRAHLNT
jgi:hypothetical protein